MKKRPYRLTCPAPWHADGRERADHGARSRVAEWKAYQAAWRRPIDEMECDAERFYHLRRNVLGLNRMQCARLLRVHRGAVLFWEQGTCRIPFAAYLALLLISESLTYRLADKVWQDWRIVGRYNDDSRIPKRERGYVAELVNRKIGAAFTPHDLEQFAMSMNRLEALESANRELRDKVDALTTENTEIRELFRVNGLTDELHGMRERVEALLGRFNTAAVLPLKKTVGA